MLAAGRWTLDLYRHPLVPESPNWLQFNGNGNGNGNTGHRRVVCAGRLSTRDFLAAGLGPLHRRASSTADSCTPPWQLSLSCLDAYA
jgi:hypothetical protein